MAFSKLTGLPLAAPLAGLVALHAEPAEACSPNPCNWEPYVSSLTALSGASIPADGVLLLRVGGDNLSNQDILEMLALEVTQNGQPVAGAVEDTGAFGVLAWRPAAPLPPGQVHQVHAVLTDPNSDPDDYYYQCGSDLLELDHEFMAEDSPSEPLSEPEVELLEQVLLVEDTGLETLVCCDGAIPSDYELCGSYGGAYWDEGACAQSSGRGFLQVNVSVKPAVADPLTRDQLLIGLRVDGELLQLDTGTEKLNISAQPFCTQVEVRNVGTGEVVLGPEQCHGQGNPEVGPQAIDPHTKLDGVCAGPLYTCELEPESFPATWDADRCKNWDETVDTSDSAPTSSDSLPGDDDDTGASSSDGDDGPGQDDLVDHGCACTNAPADPTAALGLVGLGLLARRRRRSV